LAGAVSARIQASSEAAFKRLIGRFVLFCRESLINPHWGETVALVPGLRLSISMVCQGLTREQIGAIWNPFFAWVVASPQEFRIEQQPQMLTVPARHSWDPAFMNKMMPGVMRHDDRPGAPAHHVWWEGDGDQAGQFLYGFASLWLPRSLLEEGERARLVAGLFEGSRRWPISLHFNKGLAGAPKEAVEATRDTATNPAVLDAFALAILGSNGSAAYTGLPGAVPDMRAADHDAAAIRSAMAALRGIVPDGGSYVSESDFFEENWQRSFWGDHYSRLLAVKTKYDPTGLFFVHHGVGSEYWSPDGFTRIRST
jgi:hypothetical protein